MAYWDKLAHRGSVRDRRGSRNMLVVGGGGVSIVGLALALLFNYLSGGDVTDVLTGLDATSYEERNEASTGAYAGADEYEVFASTILGSADDVWEREFRDAGELYDPPTLVLFRGVTSSACGGASSAMGPHYCSLDRTIYLDETFFDELHRRFGAGKADVAQAYVIAHEVGHHVQHELGLLEEAYVRAHEDPSRTNEISIAQELQADCFAGVWAHSLRDAGVFEAGEIKEALDAAAVVGDDTIQKNTTGRINPETWTHGSSEERVGAFTSGFESGEPSMCRL